MEERFKSRLELTDVGGTGPTGCVEGPVRIWHLHLHRRGIRETISQTFDS